jgi:type I restriction enzyme S subunit
VSVVLSEHLPLLASAPEGIQKLRGLILELAVRGKLVPQNRNDEPASELLKRIEQERARLEAQGICKKSKPMPPVGEGKEPFALPEGWKWSRIGELSSVVRGVSYDKSQASESRLSDYLPLLRGHNINQRLNFDDLVYVPAKLISQDQLIRRGDIVIAMSSGSAHLVGKAAQAENDVDIGFGAFCGLIRAHSSELHRYFGFFFQTPLYRNRVAGHGKGIGINNLQKGALLALECPVPPLAEQLRIVAKVDELMALCDRLEAEQVDAASAHARLVENLLGTLTQSTDAADLAANWQRLAEHFDTLFSTESSIDALKQTVLQLAVNGFLVPLDNHEKPDTGKLGDYVEFLNGYAFKSEWFAPSGVRLLRNANVGHGMCDWRDVVYLPADRLAEFDRFRLQAGDLVLSLDRPIINTGLKIARVACKDLPCLLLQRVAKIVPRDGMISLDYLYLWFNSPVFLSVIDPGRSNGVPHISTKQVAGLQFVRYPLEVQQRIVAKVDELMALCDLLKADLATSRQHQATLADTLIESALEAA